MNTIKLNSLTTDVAVYQQNDELYFDLLDLADRMGYSQPKKAISDFIQKRGVDIETWENLPDGNKLAPEYDLYRFLMYSNAPKALEWQNYIAIEVLPTVRKVGMVAIKKLEAQQLVNTNKQSPELFPSLEEIVDDAEQFCKDNDYYRILGYLPPSEVAPKGWNVGKFWEYINLEESDCYYCARYHNPYREDGRWYAFKTTVYHEIPEEPKDHGCPSDMDDDMPEFIPSYGSAWDL